MEAGMTADSQIIMGLASEIERYQKRLLELSGAKKH
jgi:hypothetical protein